MVQSMWTKSGTVAPSEQSSIDTSIDTLKKYGLYAEPKKKKLGVLSRIGLLLNAFSPTTAAYGSMYEGKNFATEYAKNLGKSVVGGVTGTDNGIAGEQRSTKDILVKQGMKDRAGKLDVVDVLGFAGDVVTDPTTYLTAGIAKGGTKIFAEGGKAINLSKAGTKGLEEFIRAGNYTTREIAEKAFAKKILPTAPNYLAKRGIRLAGQTVVPGAALDKVGLKAVADKGITAGLASSAVTAATHLPVVGKPVIKRLANAATDLFDPFAGIKRALPDQADFIQTTVTQFRNAKGAQKELFAERLLKIAEEAKKIDPEAGKLGTQALEAGLGVSAEDAAKVAARQAAAETAGKLIPAQVNTTLEQLGKDLGKKKAEITKLVKQRDKQISVVTDDPKKINTLTKAYAKKTDALIAEKRILEENYARLKQGKPTVGAAPAVKPQEGIAYGKIDTNATTGKQGLDNLMLDIKEINEGIYKQDVSTGLVKDKIENYVYRNLTPEAQEYMNRTGFNVTNFKKLKTNIKAGKSRIETEQFISNINKKFREKTGENFDLFDEDIFRSTLKRKFDSIEAGSNVKLNKVMNEELGVSKKALSPNQTLDGVHYVESTFQKGTYVPKEVNDLLNKLTNLSDDKSLKTFLSMYDKGLKFWKGSVTRYFPAFHARNFLGATFNNWIAGVDNPLRYTQVINIMKTKKPGYVMTKNGTKITYNEVKKMITESGILGQTGMFDVNKQLVDYQKGLGVAKATDFVTKPLRKASDVAFQSVEDEVRSTLFLDRILKGDSAREATQQVFKYHFDYSPEAFTHFENTVLKRVAPFYSWTKNNVPLQLEQLGRQPGKYAAIMKVKSMFDNERVGQTDEEGNVVTRQTIADEKALEPEYLQNQYTLSLGKGKTIQVPIPMEDLTRMKPKEAYGMLAPFIKMPFELVANKNLYLDQEIANKNLPKELQTTKTIISPKYMTPQMKKFFNAQETTTTDPITGEEKKQYEMDSTKMYIIRSLAGRIYSTVEDASKSDKAFKDKAVKFVTGMGAKETDLGKQEYYSALDKNAQLSEMTKYFRARGKMPTAEEEKASTKAIKLAKPKKARYKKAKKIKMPKAKTGSKASKQAKAKKLIQSARNNK